MKNLYFLTFVLTMTSLSAQSVERGPYTLDILSDGIYRIQDYNSSHGRGNYTNDKGESLFNNCSDMYLIVGSVKALLIDLSNNVQWADNAAESLRSLVSEYTRGRDLLITVTHSHGDHLGMLPAYTNEANVHFWIPKADFPNPGRFPEERTTLFDDKTTFDLGGKIVKTLKVEGHTRGSTLFFVDGTQFVFTGDALGSGSGVWIFNAEGFGQFKQGIAKLINYINDPANAINKDKLIIYGGHSWQGQAVWPLSTQLILDMGELVRRIEARTGFDTTPMAGSNARLDTDYKYGKAIITWSRNAEKEYIESLGNK